MKLFIVGGNSPTAADLIEILRMQKIPYKAPPDKFFNPDEGVAIAKMITDYGPTQLINLADFISGNHSALKRAESSEERCYQINASLPVALGRNYKPLEYSSTSFIKFVCFRRHEKVEL